MTNAEHGDGQHRNRLRIAIWGVAAFALLLPWVAMQFTSEVVWEFGDFAIFGTMLLLACGTYELATRLTGNKVYRLAFGIALVGALISRFESHGMAYALVATAIAQALVAGAGRISSSCQH